MHELSLIQSVMETAESHCRRHGLNRVTALKLVVGQYTAALPEALNFAFEALKEGTILQDALLIIEEQRLQARCKACGEEYQPTPPWLVCPRCGQAGAEIIAGKELYLEYIEGEKNHENPGG